MDLDAYRAEAEDFLSSIDREYYEHYSGQKDEFDIEPIYDRHAALFSRESVDSLREAGAAPALIEFSVQGLIGQELKAGSAELARREAALELEWDGETVPLRSTAVLQANEPDADRRAELEGLRNELTASELNPLSRELLERSHALARDLGWSSMRDLCQDLSGTDFGALAEQTERFLEETEDTYEQLVEPEVREQIDLGFDVLRRSDLVAFFRAPSLDAGFPEERLVPSLTETLGGMGIDVAAQSSVTIDAERRPKKSPRAFCAPVRVPDEVYLVIAPVGGREDFAALFHEAGHTEHYAHVDAALPMEDRYLGDNSVTEGFAFLFEHLTSDPEWLSRRLGIDDPGPIVRHERASRLVFLRRYAAKLAYELELHGGGAIDGLDAVYARRLSDAIHVDWPAVSWLSDVDPFFYVARYLRAWALETHVRAELQRALRRRMVRRAGGRRVPTRAVERRPGRRRRRGNPPARRWLGARLRRGARRGPGLTESLPHRAEHRLAVGVAALVVAHLAQLGRTQVLQAALHLRGREVVIGRDREARPEARRTADAVGPREHRVGLLAGLRGGVLHLLARTPGGGGAPLAGGAGGALDLVAAAAEQLLEVGQHVVGLLAPAIDDLRDEALSVV